ncbi:hypothetical protein [Paraclostridium bifermentans]
MKKSLELLIKAILNINDYDLNLGSLNKKIEKIEQELGFKRVYSKVLEYVGREEIDKELIDLINQLNIDVACRIKTEESIRKKWDKNLGAKRDLNKVFNDLIGVRIVTDIDIEEVIDQVDQIKEDTGKNIKIIDFNKKHKSVDDGYRGIHVYIKNNPKCFQSEIQIWTKIDAVLNFYTHQNIYKLNLQTQYPLELRLWMDNIPKSRNVDIKFEDYLYNMIIECDKYGNTLAKAIVDLEEKDEFSDSNLLITHYKSVTNEHNNEYILELQKWIDNIPSKDKSINFSFFEYIYNLNLREVI